MSKFTKTKKAKLSINLRCMVEGILVESILVEGRATNVETGKVYFAGSLHWSFYLLPKYPLPSTLYEINRKGG